MRLLPFIAAACLLTIAPSAADAARLPVSRRADPTLDQFDRTLLPVTPLSAMTADQTWLSANESPIVVYDSDPTVSLNITGWATKPNVAVYYNATGYNNYEPTKLAEAAKYLMTVSGKPVMVDGWRAFDVTNPAARNYWLYGSDGKASCTPDRNLRAALDLYACGYKSLWLDNALTTPKQGFTPTPSIKPAVWAKGMLTMLGQLRALKPAGTTFTINMHWTDTDYGYANKPKLPATLPQIRAGKLANQVIIEGGAIDPGLHYALPANVPWSYARLLNFADAMHHDKVKLQWEKTGSGALTATKTPIKGSPQLAALPDCRDTAAGSWALGSAEWQAHVRSAAFNYSSALLSYASGDSVGDMCEYPQRGWRGYQANLGNPVGKRFVKGKLIERKFTSGFIAVNPSDKAVKAKLPSGKKGVNLASTVYPLVNTAVTAVTLPPRSAAVIKY